MTSFIFNKIYKKSKYITKNEFWFAPIFGQKKKFNLRGPNAEIFAGLVKCRDEQRDRRDGGERNK